MVCPALYMSVDRSLARFRSSDPGAIERVVAGPYPPGLPHLSTYHAESICMRAGMSGGSSGSTSCNVAAMAVSAFAAANAVATTTSSGTEAGEA